MGLFKASLDGIVRRAIDIHRGQAVDAQAFQLGRCALKFHGGLPCVSVPRRKVDLHGVTARKVPADTLLEWRHLHSGAAAPDLTMPLVSVTRLRIRSPWYLPAFFFHTLRATRQARTASGNQGVQLLPDAHRTFWTCTLWTDLEAMRAYVSAGSHRQSMKRLAHWCDEASVVHWQQESQKLPSWEVAHRRMQQEGRPSKVCQPSAAHLAFQIAPPRGTTEATKAN